MPTDLPVGATPTYTQQYRRCGKSACPLCAEGGRGHGPYWYAYWREGGRTRSRYLGKQPPPDRAALPPQQSQPPAAPDAPTLRVRTLGGFALWRGAAPIPVAAWERQQSATLCKWLLSAPGQRLTRDEVVERFWPEGLPEQGRANLRVVVYRLRKALQDAADDSAYVQYDGEVLTLRPGAAAGSDWLDAAVFAQAATAALAGHAPAACRSALALYTGDYLPEDAYEEWALQRREELRGLRLRLLLHLAALAGHEGEQEEAERCLRSVLAEDRCHEEAAVALMRLHAATGRLGQALRVYRRLTEALWDDLALEPEEETQALARSMASQRPTTPSVTVRETAPHNLPAPLTSFIGRRRALTELRSLLHPAQAASAELMPCRLLTLIGPGGAGKTRLALRVADDLLDDQDAYPDGVWLVELASLADPPLVPKAVAAALGVQEDARPLVETLILYLQAKRLLVVLDNCEHLLDACADLVARVLPACPVVQVLATSRAALGVPGERPWPVPVLSLPEVTVTGAVGRLLESEAVRLFLERARVHRPDLTVTSENAGVVARICRHLEGIPLALELAAARVSVLSLDQIADRLQESVQLLTGGPRTAPRRQRTLRATLDWSYNLLNVPERTLLRRLAVCVGGCTLEAVEAVCAGEGLASEDVLEVLGGLVRHSLVQVDDAGDAHRFHLLETVRQYGMERLEAAPAGDSGEAAQTRARHAAHYLALAEAAESQLLGAAQAAWMERLEQEHENLRAALQWSMKQDGSTMGLRICGALWRFWFTRGYLSEGRQWLKRSLDLPASTAAQIAPTRAKALNGAGSLAYYQSDYPEALLHYERALALYRELGDTRGVAATLGNVGLVVKEQGDYSRAARLYADSLVLYRELGDARGMANALNNLGIAAGDQGDYAQARNLHEQSLAMKRTLEDRRGIVTSLNNLGAIAIDQGDDARALVLLEESLALARELGHRQSMIVALHNLGRMARGQGLVVRAVDLYRQSLSLCQALGARIALAQVLEGLASCACLRQDFHRAARLYGAAGRMREDAQSPSRPVAAGDRATYDQDRVLMTTALGEAVFTAEWTVGQAMTLDQAAAYAPTIESDPVHPRS